MLEGCIPYPAEFVARYRSGGYWLQQTLSETLAKLPTASAQPAVVDDYRELTLAQVLGEAGAAARFLAGLGLTAGDRIVIQLPNRTEFVALLIACLELGVVPVMALQPFRRVELEYLITHSHAKALAIAPEYRGFDYAAMARELRRRCPSLELLLSSAPAAECHPIPREPWASIGQRTGDSLEVALFLLSGGTTGLPKLIPRTHADYQYNARQASQVCALGPASRILLALPIEHNFPLACPGLLGALLGGATAVLTESSRSDDLVRIIDGAGITHLPCVPTLAIGLLEAAARAGSKLTSLRVVTVGGARLKVETAIALHRAFPGLRIQQVFGMAEGLLCYTRLDDPEEVAFDTQGRPLSPADEVRIVDSEGRDLVGDGVGELWCRGPYTIRGYYRAAERNREAFTPDGFYKTGDLVRRVSGGNLVVEGRIKDLINRGGEKISAEEIEGHLLAHPAISNAAVVAMPDPVLGERGCAFVTVNGGGALDLAAIREFLASRELARYKWPERLEVIEQMPLTNVGKIQKAELRAAIASKLAQERTSVFELLDHDRGASSASPIGRKSR